MRRGILLRRHEMARCSDDECGFAFQQTHDTLCKDGMEMARRSEKDGYVDTSDGV